MRNHIFTLLSAFVLVGLFAACELVVNPDQAIDDLTEGSNYVRFNDEDGVTASITDTQAGTASFTFESLPNNTEPIDITYTVAGLGGGVDGEYTATMEEFNFEVDVDLSIPADLLGGGTPISTDTIMCIVGTDTTQAFEFTYEQEGTITITGASNGVTIGRGTNVDALGEELDPISIPVTVTQLTSTCQ